MMKMMEMTAKQKTVRVWAGATGVRHWLALALVLVTLFPFVSLSQACSIPVFRYGLDRWPADMYKLELSSAEANDPAVAKFFRNLGGTSPLNIEGARLPAAEGKAPSRLMWPHADGAPPMWSGRLDAATLGTLTNSPARMEIVKRLLAGESAVWVFVESGNKLADEASAARLSKRLKFLESAAQLPSIDPSDPSSRLGPGPELRIKFSLLRIRPDDPAEVHFISMLGGPKGVAAKDGFFAPVFARGRVLGAWPANAMDSEHIDEACLFLLGACSCRVKQINPGWDLLLAVDWDESLRAMGFAALPAPGAGGESKPVETVMISGGAPPVAPAAPATAATKLGAAAVTLFLIALGGLAWHNGATKS